jgi:formylglycine-generating enzyme required for sulfatase activity
MGSDERDERAWDDEKPRHRVHLPGYYIARTPVTNAQYAFFVHETGHRIPKHWREGGVLRVKRDHPVVYVSWHDAVAYCQWLAGMTGKPYRLPTEAQWEKAARGPDGQIYPWGDGAPTSELCNYYRGYGYVGGTTPVGQYSPQGDSYYGCVDMAGNVWEWTSSLWGADWSKPDFGYPYDPHDGRENLEAGDDVLRVVRGGSFFDSGGGVRCASRYRYSPGYVDLYSGVRVALVSPFFSLTSEGGV